MAASDRTGYLGETMFEEVGTSVAPVDGGKTVLVCDDEPKLALLTAGLLQDHGFQTVTVNRGDHALEQLVAEVGVLLLDVNLGEGPTALEVLDGMAGANTGAKAILTSGFAAEDLPLRLTGHSRVAGYLSKPYSAAQLVEQVRKAMQAANGTALDPGTKDRQATPHI